jgi:type II secretory pathway component GspD/PulD (secretin)
LGKPASFFAGSMIQTAPTGGSLVTIDAGDKLEVTPVSLADDGLVTLDITMTSAELAGQSSSSILSQNALGQGLSNQLIQVNSSKVSTIIKAYPGQTIMLGGLKTTTRKNTDSRFPLLGNIPILQYFFSSVQNQVTEATIIYLLTVRLGGQSKKAYMRKAPIQNVFSQLHAADPKAFSFCATPTMGLILKHLAKTSLFSDFQSGDVTVVPDTYMNSLPDRLEQLTSFLYF